jgi:septal ring factor EnvC (AmiA/AmiB activator)
VEVNLSKIDKEIIKLEGNKKKLENTLKGRLNVIYKTRQGGMLRVLFSTEDPNNLGRNLYYIKSLVNYDMLLFDEFEDNSLRLKDGRERLSIQKTELEILSKEYKSKRDILLQQKKRRRSIIEKVRNEEALQLASIKELESAAVDLQNLLNNLKKRIDEEEEKSFNADFASMKGRLEMPVDGRIISYYGKIKHPKFKTVTFNKGVEILAAVGSEVSAVFEGEVVYSGWFKGYGKMMIVDHRNGYYTLLAHLSETLRNVGEKVNKGEVVALVGDTGSLKGPMLYFEVRYHGEPKDPLDWIAKK